MTDEDDQQKEIDFKINEDLIKRVTKELSSFNDERPKLMYKSHILKNFDKTVSGQAEAKDKLASLGYLYQNKIQALYNGIKTDSVPRLNLFVTGPTGYGKTFILTQLANILNLPFIRIDCSTVTAEGWVGDSVSDLISTQLSPLCECTIPGLIIMLDEMDKVITPAVGNSGTDHSVLTQQSFLDLMEGKFVSTGRDLTPFKKTVITDAVQKALVVCAGSFEQVRQADKAAKANIGFTRIEKDKSIDLERWKESMVDAGMLPELAGRIVQVVELSKLTEDEILQIFEKDKSVYKQYQAILPGFNLSKEKKKEIAKKVIESRFGLRELESLIFKEVIKKLEDY